MSRDPDTSREMALSMLIRTASGRRTDVVFLLQGPDLQIWVDGVEYAVFGRKVVRVWLADPPSDTLLIDGSGFVLDRRVDPVGQVAVALSLVGRYRVPVFLLTQLRSWL